MSEYEEEEDDEETSPSKKGKKKYYPFGTPNHTSQAFSTFAHLKNQHTQEFAAQLAYSSTTYEAIEIAEVKPKKVAKRATSKTATSTAAAIVENPIAAIPDTEGLEPCTKIPCQLVLRAMADIQFRNEVERDEIEDEYERLLQELVVSEQEMAAAEAKMVLLNDVGSQLEQKHDQLVEKVTTLERTKDSQDSERNDINNKVLQCCLLFAILSLSCHCLTVRNCCILY